MKKCKSCGEVKPLRDYYKEPRVKSGVAARCKVCSRVWQKPTKEKSTYDKLRRKLKGQELRSYDRERSKDPRRKALHAEETVRRRRTLKQQTPEWANRESIRGMYLLAQKWTKLFGVEYQVDHVIPLRGKNICGLHVETNLQLLEKSLNQKKSNVYD